MLVVIRRALSGSNLSSVGKMLFKTVLCAFLICMIMSMTDFSAQSESISDSVLRVHIIANSDSEKDQELKLNVRDLVQNMCYNIYKEENITTLSEAESVISDNLGSIQDNISDYIRDKGFDYDVKAETVNMYFTNRVYDDITLPAGYYDAVRITLGEGKGHNWWCVMFPPICINAAENKSEISDVLSDKQTEIVTDGSYQYKFKIYEMYCDIAEKINRK